MAYPSECTPVQALIHAKTGDLEAVNRATESICPQARYFLSGTGTILPRRAEMAWTNFVI